ncbi:MAG: 2-oxoacid:acceptor oxidoreductase subunit alpha [Chloroflexota bacterium]
MAAQLLQGNEACALGALAAGCSFFGGYPITPSTDVAEVMARELPKRGGKFIQMEDEIASIAAVLGASVGGAKAMTATSGPGFSLMQENIGYAAMAEIPCVIVNVQRAGPSTGLPTSPSQGDVMQARWGTHGDHPIIALSPSTVGEVFDLTVQAFNLSEKYRTPVILLMDEVVGHMRERTELPPPGSLEVVDRIKPHVPPDWYFPYEETSADVPPFASFGEGYRFHITGLFHDRAGFPTQRLDEIQPWIERVFNKISRHEDDIIRLKQEWVDDAATIVVAYGATARSAREAVRMARHRGRKVGLVKLFTIWPFPERVFRQLARQGKRFVIAEMNLGQLSLELERVVGRNRVSGVHRADGQLITPNQILQATGRRAGA